ncbi:MAG: dihydroorotate dehydrogenase electron transfer subunit [Planctomycetes bacterium]|nr:dihydroorotate dehydrogenase electron transfer subunit [Planctomycetota bacterium]
MKSVQGRITLNRREARNTYRMRVAFEPFPARVDAGQFIHVRALPSEWDPLLRRPFSIMDAGEEGGNVSSWDLLYLVQGRVSGLMTEMQPGARLDVLGPLGHGYRPVPDAGRHLLVGGGVGVPPLYFLARQLLSRHQVAADRVVALVGARSADLLACVDDFRALGIPVRVSTDDGTAFEKGRVTDLMRREARPGDAIYTCGPEGMLHAVVALARDLQLSCQVSVERNMGCGLGACKTCVVDMRVPPGAPPKYRTTCREGPVFDAGDLP